MLLSFTPGLLPLLSSSLTSRALRTRLVFHRTNTHLRKHGTMIRRPALQREIHAARAMRPSSRRRRRNLANHLRGLDLPRKLARVLFARANHHKIDTVMMILRVELGRQNTPSVSWPSDLVETKRCTVHCERIAETCLGLERLHGWPTARDWMRAGDARRVCPIISAQKKKKKKKT